MSAMCQKRTLERRLFNHVVCTGDQRRWHVKVERLRDPKVDGRIWLAPAPADRQVSRP